jgi:hypothetical protein
MKVAVAVLATVLAVGATAATAQQLIGSAQIRNNSIQGKDVRNKSLTKKDFRGSVRGPRGFTGPAGPAGPRGATGATGPAGPTILGRIVRVVSPTTVIAAGDVGSATAVCPPNYGIVSGGVSFTAADGEIFYEDSFDGVSWSVGGDNFDSLVTGELEAVALCAPRGQALSTAKRSNRRDRVAALEARQRAKH